MRNVTTTAPALVRTETHSASTEVALTYTETDPYAVTLTVGGVTCCFARDLLADYVSGQAGDGDVTIAHDGDNVHVCVSNRSGWARVAIPEFAVAEFLASSYVLVPRGAEVVDIDQMLAELTAPQQ